MKKREFWSFFQETRPQSQGEFFCLPRVFLIRLDPVRNFTTITITKAMMTMTIKTASIGLKLLNCHTFPASDGETRIKNAITTKDRTPGSGDQVQSRRGRLICRKQALTSRAWKHRLHDNWKYDARPCDPIPGQMNGQSRNDRTESAGNGGLGAGIARVGTA